MSDVLERLAEMGRKLYLELDDPSRCSTSEAALAAIHRHTMLVARKVCLDNMREHAQQIGLGTLFNLESARMAANGRFPLPPKRVLREEPDPKGAGVMWRWLGSSLEYSSGDGRWFALVGSAGGDRVFAPYPERIDLWHSLKHNPYREVPDNGDE